MQQRLIFLATRISRESLRASCKPECFNMLKSPLNILHANIKSSYKIIKRHHYIKCYFDINDNNIINYINGKH